MYLEHPKSYEIMLKSVIVPGISSAKNSFFFFFSVETTKRTYFLSVILSSEKQVGTKIFLKKQTYI